MSSSNCVKISYKGLTRHILCNTKFDELVEKVMEKFNIASSCKGAIEFYDEHGNKYNKNTFEYLLVLFPNPQKIFFVRLDTSKIVNVPSSAEENQSMLVDVDRLPFGKSKLNNCQTTNAAPVDYYEAVPVKRQNCFLGALPPSTSTQQHVTSSQCDSLQSLSIEIVKRMRQLKQSPPKKKHLNNSNGFKRSLRI